MAAKSKCSWNGPSKKRERKTYTQRDREEVRKTEKGNRERIRRERTERYRQISLDS